MIVIYDTKKGTFTAYKDYKVASDISSIRVDVLKSVVTGSVIHSNGIIIGKLDIVKSTRGGKR